MAGLGGDTGCRVFMIGEILGSEGWFLWILGLTKSTINDLERFWVVLSKGGSLIVSKCFLEKSARLLVGRLASYVRFLVADSLTLSKEKELEVDSWNGVLNAFGDSARDMLGCEE